MISDAMDNIKCLVGNSGIIKSVLYVVGSVPISLFKGVGSFELSKILVNISWWYGYRYVLLLPGSILWGVMSSTCVLLITN